MNKQDDLIVRLETEYVIEKKKFHFSFSTQKKGVCVIIYKGGWSMKQKTVKSWEILTKHFQYLCIGSQGAKEKVFIYIIMSMALWSIKLNGLVKRAKWIYMCISLCQQSLFICNERKAQNEYLLFISKCWE